MVGTRLRVPSALALLAGGVLLAWASALCAMRLGFVQAPQSTVDALTYAVPAVLVLLALVHRGEVPGLALAAGLTCAVSAALVLPPRMMGNPDIALAVPAAVCAGLLTARFPALSLTGVFLLAGTYGSVTAFTGVPGDSVMDKIIVGLWVGVIGRMFLARREVRVRPTPALMLVAAFLVACVLAALTTEPVESGIRALRLGPLFMSLVLLLGWGGFSRRTLDRLVKCIVAVAFVGSAYAALRWAVGPAAKEQSLLSSAMDRQYNQLAITGDDKVQGALPNGFLLGLWCACVIPMLVAVVIGWRGIFRLVALGSIPLATIAILGSSQRAALAAAVAGSLTIVVAHVLSRGARGPRLGVAVATALVLVAGASVVYPAVLDNPEKQKRYENLLTPSQDSSFQERLTKWESALDAIEDRRWGHGLGAGNPQTVSHRFLDIAQYEIDNSFLMIAYDQGMLVLALFGAAVLFLLIELLRHAVWTRGPGGAALAAAGAGTLVAISVEFMTTDFFYAPALVAGWMVVGLGVAQFTSGDQYYDEPEAAAYA
jgi:hypothetical protein